MARLNFLTVTFILCSLNQAASEVYHITTGPGSGSSNDLCTAPCLTLSQFIANYNYLHDHSDTTMVFLPGTHRLTVNLRFSNLQNFTISSKTSTTRILCTPHSHMIFKRSQYIHIANLEFIGCRENQIEDIRWFEIQHSKFMDSGTALQLIETTARILNCTFATTSNNTIHGSTGALYSKRSNLRIKESHFASNNATQYGAGLYSTSSDVIIEASHFTDNKAARGGGI